MHIYLETRPESLAVCRLPPGVLPPPEVFEAPFYALTRTVDELSIVLPESLADPSWRVEGGWRALKVRGPLPFGMVGVVAALSASLATAGISIFVISTFDTDYLLVKAAQFPKAVDVLRDDGHSVEE